MEILEEGYYYHIYNRGNSKEKLFIEKEDYSRFMELYRKYIHEIADTFCFCLMPNHFHFALRIKERGEIISSELKNKSFHQSFSNFFNAYAKYFNINYVRTGSLFQKNFKRKRVDNEIYLKFLIHYIHTNPVHHEICDDFTKYRYSSYQAILNNHPSILHRDYVIELFENENNFAYTHRQKSRTVLIRNLIKGD